MSSIQTWQHYVLIWGGPTWTYIYILLVKLHLLWWWAHPFWEKVWQFLIKIKYTTPLWLNIPIFGVYPREIKAPPPQPPKTCIQMYTAVCILNSQWMGTHSMSIKRWMEKQHVKYSLNNISSSNRKNKLKIHPTTWV